MNKARLEAFSDGVIAILITIMVLELKTPHGTTWEALRPLVPVFLTYVLSFVFLGVYWNNHHHMLQAADHVDGRVLWANLHLLFWLSLVPFVTGWMGENHFEPLPTAGYGVVMFMAGLAYYVLQRTFVAHAHAGRNAKLAAAIGRDGKGRLSLALYVTAIPLAFVNQWLSDAIYVTVLVMWFLPDRRIEASLQHPRDPGNPLAGHPAG
jgi:uncharacterized membrane protein